VVIDGRDDVTVRRQVLREPRLVAMVLIPTGYSGRACSPAAASTESTPEPIMQATTISRRPSHTCTPAIYVHTRKSSIAG
jgi:hypothetical protein